MNRTTPSRRWGPAAALLCVALASLTSCKEDLPTAIDDGQLPQEPITLEIQLGWSDFASNLRVYGGFSSPLQLRRGVLAHQYEGSLESRTLLRFASYPSVLSVRDSAGTTRPDSMLTYIGGRVVAYIDSESNTNTGPVTLDAGALQEVWDPATASWTYAVDSVGAQVAWTQPGAGPVTPLASAVWDPTTGPDSVVFAVDSATIAAWADTLDLSRGVRIDLPSDSARLEIAGALLFLDVRPSLDPDTTLVVPTQAAVVTYVFDPVPPPPPDGMRVGGAPAWRSVFDVSLDANLTGPPELCAAVGCPFALRSRHVTRATLDLTSRAAPAAFLPTDSVAMDVRAVLSPTTLPKSPLGSTLIADPLGARLPPEAFGSMAGVQVEVPVTPFVRAYLAGVDATGAVAPRTLAILSKSEPSSPWFASFQGPGGPDEPVLNLILTVSPPLELP